MESGHAGLLVDPNIPARIRPSTRWSDERRDDAESVACLGGPSWLWPRYCALVMCPAPHSPGGGSAGVSILLD